MRNSCRRESEKNMNLRSLSQFALDPNFPAMASTTFFTILVPRPVPPGFVLIAFLVNNRSPVITGIPSFEGRVHLGGLQNAWFSAAYRRLVCFCVDINEETLGYGANESVSGGR
jgi:hypothetical protein